MCDDPSTLKLDEEKSKYVLLFQHNCRVWGVAGKKSQQRCAPGGRKERV
jgi:hypothetical protein